MLFARTSSLSTCPASWLTSDIYRIVSSKSLESSGDVIKPSGGETILVTPTADDGGAKQGGKCC